MVVATGVSMDGNREVLGCAVGHSEDGAFWTEFLRSLRARGLGGVRLVISDQHLGLKKAIEAVMVGAAWQRCRVHFMRNVLARVKRNNTHMVIAAIQTIFAQPDAAAVRGAVRPDRGHVGDQFPDVATMLTDAKEDLLAFSAFPERTGARSGRRIPSNASTARSSVAPTWSGSSQRPGGRTPRHRRGRRDPRRVAGGRASLSLGDLDGPAPAHEKAAVAEAAQALESRPLAG